MKRSIFFYVTIALALGLFFLTPDGNPVSCWAQSPTFLKNASAVYQLIEKNYVVNPDGSYTVTLHVITRVLTYKGKKDHADFRYPYNKSYQSVEVVSAHTRTASGKSIPVTEKEIHDINAPEDARATLYSRQHVKVINFPSVEPGATLEITLKIHAKKGFWAMECFRLSDPIVRKVVRVSLPATMKLTPKLPAIKLVTRKSQKGGRVSYQWEARNVPRTIDEPFLPPLENRETCLFLTTLPSWETAARFFTDTFPADAALPDKVAFIQGTTPDDIYLSLMKHVITYPIDFFHTALTFQTPAETLKKGYGSSIDLAILFHALLKKRGFAPTYLMANTGNVLMGEFRETPFPPLFDDLMVRCKGKDYAFYTKDLPPGYTGLQGKQVLDLTNGNLTPSLAHYANRDINRLTLIPTEAFALEGKFLSTMEGQPAVATRKWLRYMTKDEWRIAKNQILHDIDPLASPMGEISRKGLKTLTAPVVLEGKFTIPVQFPGTGEFLFIHLEKPDLSTSLASFSERRRGPLMITRTTTSDLEERITLPKGVIVQYRPDDTEGISKVMDWSLKTTVTKGHLIFHRVIRLKRGILHPGTRAYRDFIEAIRRLYRPANHLIVLEKK